MKHFMNQLSSCIRDPDYIYKSKHSANTKLYYRFEQTKYGEIFILAIINMKLNKNLGYVKTALPVYKIKEGELIWEKT